MASLPLQWAMAVRLRMNNLSISSAMRLRRSACSLPISSTSTVTVTLSVRKTPPRWLFLPSSPQIAAAYPIIPQSVRPRISCSRFPCFASDPPSLHLVIVPLSSRVSFDAWFQHAADRLALSATYDWSARRASNVWELWEVIAMRRNRRRRCVAVASVLCMFFNSGLSRAQDIDSVLRSTLVLPELIQEVLARNPELVAARKQWEGATTRIAQARSLDDPTLSVQLWN
ncbi:MAG: TolC family protein, partial [Nitrospirota bacterium]|nr:TolC family protein [Nitrospirota bacterium]